MTRETSIEAYREIERSGLLSLRRWQVYKIVFENGPMTGLQVIKKFREEARVFSNSGTVNTRLSELRDRKVVREIGKTVCPVSGRVAILWDVTKALPIKFEKPSRHKCKTCNGTGYITERQAKLF